ncbi:hypothetical protein TIFTF001_045925 [Ficus carica]|uniref:soluble epoxide hydrolase n=1 Tax=Ficus carica TaxID=3494 RepID=A0AA87YXE1_FICCA|nr:hypothetical protein TIFTF001_045909 [Ficus carica]GMN25067.1 hypothetical protein TIFTF001_045910 [Ficus carica]GMN25098.1 hypothetical protein TIFTF001_045913 [Ficus carica]GMN25218.1 hypothetical protein TIFTF001_045925 [Ficus carica]
MKKIEHKTIHTNGINMHVASIGCGPAILFLHGFPELWYSWRHQMLALSSLGYRCIAPDLRGYGDTDAPPSPASYTVFHIVGDLVGLIEQLGVEQVFLVGHDWGAIIAWYLCLFRPDKIKALVNLSVPFFRRNPNINFVEGFRAVLGDDFYMCRFQIPGESEEDFSSDTANVFRRIFANLDPKPPLIAKEIGFRGVYEDPVALPSWLSEEDINHFANKFNQTGFTGGLNYYRALNPTWELTAAWTGAQVKVPTKFIVGDLDLVYHFPGMKEYIHNDGGFKRDVPSLQEVIVMEGVAHFINQEKPREITSHIHQFFHKF